MVPGSSDEELGRRFADPALDAPAREAYEELYRRHEGRFRACLRRLVQARHFDDLILLDFEEAYKRNSSAAVRLLLLLLLDEAACRTRVAYLLRLKAEGQDSGAPLPSRPTERPFDEEIRLICDVGLPAALDEGKLTPEVVHRLYRLTCDPDALLEAHRKLIEPPPTPPALVGDNGQDRTRDSRERTVGP
jgi:hypothetical protein